MSGAEISAAGARRRPVFARMAQFGRAAVRIALDAALPPLCAACRSPLGDLGGLYCERLGIPFAYDPGPGVLSMEAIADPPAYGRARAAVRFDDVARDLVHRLKYGDRLDLAAIMGRWMARAGRELTEEADALVPVPLHWRRLWGRRFNQAAMLAQAVAATRDLPVLHGALRRVRATPPQVGLARAERPPCRGAFGVTPKGRPRIPRQRWSGQTRSGSGATIDTCARALRAARRAAMSIARKKYSLGVITGLAHHPSSVMQCDSRRRGVSKSECHRLCLYDAAFWRRFRREALLRFPGVAIQNLTASRGAGRARQMIYHHAHGCATVPPQTDGGDPYLCGQLRRGRTSPAEAERLDPPAGGDERGFNDEAERQRRDLRNSA